MDSVERSQRARRGKSERGEKLYNRKPEDDHSKDKSYKKKLYSDDNSAVPPKK